jgi:hypothetical protein
MSQPWIGKEYVKTNLLLLGESAFSWEEEGAMRHPSATHCSDLVNWVIDDFDGCRRDIPFIAKISRALANEETPSSDRLKFVWDRVAFVNYVTESVGDGPRIPPTDIMWANAKKAFPDTLENLKPRRIIILGIRMWGKMPDCEIYITDHVQGYKLANGQVAMCQAVNHPSRGLSWRELAAIVQFSYQKELSAE